ncbi:MAG: HEAT repeat domain-containing protein [Desulfobacterales bacterium]|nr:HEAT repeat domain-containing protein [Desulfobacterales bacterium]
MLLVFLFGCVKQQSKADYNIKPLASDNKGLNSKLTLPLDNPNANIRLRAIKNITKLGNEASEAINKVIQVAENDPHENVRAHALTAIGSIHPDKLEAFNYLRIYSNNSKSRKLKVAAKEASESAMFLFFSDGIVIKNTENMEIANLVIVPEFKHYNGYQKFKTVLHYGVLAVRIKVINLSSSKLSFDAEDFVLYAPDSPSTPFNILSAQEASSRMQHSVTGSVVRVVMFGAFALRSPSKTSKANNSIAGHTSKVNISKIEINPNSSRSGYIFVDVSKRMNSIANYTLSVRLRDMTNDDIYDVKCVFGDKSQVSFIKGQSSIKQVESDNDIKTKLINLKTLRDEGLITNEEYIKKKDSLLNEY